MDYYVSPDLDKKLRKIIVHNKQLAKQIEKQLLLFQQNHLHPSLRVHKLTGNQKNIWSISIDNKIRMMFFLDEESAYFFDIGTHDQVYK